MAAVTYARRISGIERGYLNAQVLGSAPMIHLVLDGTGVIDADALRAAVAAAAAANPGFTVARRGNRWRGGAAVPSVVVHSGIADPNEVAAFGVPIDVVAGPVAEVHLFGAGDRTRLVLRASHAVTDGRGMEHFLGAITAALRDEGVEAAPDQHVDTDLIAAADARRTPRSSAPAALAEPVTAPLGGSGAGPIAWTTRVAPGPVTSMTARIASALAATLTEPATIIVPVDLRRHDRSVRSTANLSAQLPITLQPGATWQQVQGVLLAALARNRELDTLRGDFLSTNPFAGTMHEARVAGADGRSACLAIISDHGHLDPGRHSVPGGDARAGFTATRLHTLPMLVPYAAMFVSSFTHDDQTVLTVAHRADDDPAAVTGLLDRLVASLPEKASRSSAPVVSTPDTIPGAA